MIVPIPPLQVLNDLASAINQSNNNSQIYLYKNENGVVFTSNLENFNNTDAQFGVSYTFINGDQEFIMSFPSYENINFINKPIQTLGVLYNSKLKLWIDGSDKRTKNEQLQKLVSKSYGTMSELVENTTLYNFTMSQNSINCVNNSNIESKNMIDVLQYFKLAMVFKIDPNKYADNKLIFQHNRLKIRLTLDNAADGTQQLMMSLYDNATFLKGLELNVSNETALYYVLVDNQANLFVNSMKSNNIRPSYNFYQPTTDKIYISSKNGESNISSNIELFELLYYCSSANDCPTDNDINAYINGKYTISTYELFHNTPPISNGWFYNDTSDKLFTTMNFTNNYFNLLNANTSTPNVTILNAKQNNSVSIPYHTTYAIDNSINKRYIEFTAVVNAGYIGLGFMSHTGTYDTSSNSANYSIFYRIWNGGSNIHCYGTHNSNPFSPAYLRSYYGGSFPQGSGSFPANGTSAKYSLLLTYNGDGSVTFAFKINGNTFDTYIIPANQYIATTGLKLQPAVHVESSDSIITYNADPTYIQSGFTYIN